MQFNHVISIYNIGAERDRTDSIDSESHLEGGPSGKVKKNMLGRITSKMSKPFKSRNSSNRSDAGSETGSQASAVEYAAILDERTSHSSGTATAGAIGATGTGKYSGIYI